MANLSIVKLLPKRVAELYKELKNITSKLHRTSGSIGFIKKALHNEVTPKFAQVKGNFININDRFKSEKSILLSHLNDHVRSYKLLISKLYVILLELSFHFNLAEHIFLRQRIFIWSRASQEQKVKNLCVRFTLVFTFFQLKIFDK